jgi:hypothetical protein
VAQSPILPDIQFIPLQAVQHSLHQPLVLLKLLLLVVEEEVQPPTMVVLVEQEEFYILNLFQYLPVLVVP